MNYVWLVRQKKTAVAQQINISEISIGYLIKFVKTENL